MKIFSAADDFLMDRIYQKFSWWFQKKTGKTNFWLASLCCTLMAAAFIVTGVRLISDSKFLNILILVAILTLVIFVEVVKKIFSKFENRFLERAGNSANRARIALFNSRIIMLLLGLFLIVRDIMSVISNIIALLPFSMFFVIDISLFSVYYFFSCTPLPPGQERERKKIGGKLSPVTGKT